MARNNNRRMRTVRPTLLAVGEGPDDSAFLKYLRSVYCKDYEGVKLTTQPAHGKCPKHIINVAIKVNGDFDKRIALLDIDVKIKSQEYDLATKNNITLINPQPSIEAMLLRILGKKPPSTTKECKRALKKLFPNADFKNDTAAYQKYFPLELIETSRDRIPELDQLIKLIKGEW